MSPNLFDAMHVYLPASSSETSNISNIAKPSVNVCVNLDEGRIGIPFFSHEISHSDESREHVNLTDDEFSVTVRSLSGVAKFGRSVAVNDAEDDGKSKRFVDRWILAAISLVLLSKRILLLSSISFR